MSYKSKSRNETFWPDDLVTGRERALGGWTPIPRVLTANWSQFALGDEHFSTLVWLLSWVRGKDIANVRFGQFAIARQQGRHRSTVYRRMQAMERAGIFRFVDDGHVSFEPLMEKLRQFEANRRAKRAVESLDASLKAVGLLENKGGRPPKPDQPSAAAFGEPAYEDLVEGDDSAWHHAVAPEPVVLSGVEPE